MRRGPRRCVRALLAVLAVLAVVACASCVEARPADSEESEPASLGENAEGRRQSPGAGLTSLLPTTGTGPLDALSRRFGRLRDRLRQSGYARDVGASRFLLLEAEGMSLPVDLPANECTTFVAVATSSVHELDLSVFDGEGASVATDAVGGEGGLTHVCPRAEPGGPSTLPHYLVIETREGSGAVVVGAFASRPNEGEGFEGLFDGILAPRVPLRAVEEQLAQRRALLRQRGLLPLGEPTLASVAEGEEVLVAVELQADYCYVAMARAGEGLTDVDLTVFDPEGAEVARDLGSDAESDVELCPDEAGRFRVHALAFEGAGALGVLVVGGPKPVETVVQETIETPLPERVEGQGDLDPSATLRPAVQVLLARGHAEVTYIVPEGTIGPGEVRSHDLDVQAGCYVIVGAPSRAETDLDLYLAVGDVSTDRDTGIEPAAEVRACPREPTSLRLSVKAYGRRSRYAVAILRAPDRIDNVQALRLEEASATLAVRGYRPQRTATRSMERGQTHTESLRVPPHTCAAVAAAGDAEVEDIDLFLRDAAARLVASSAGPEPFAAVNRCAGETEETLTLEVVVYRGRGDVAITQLTGAP